MAKTLKDPSQSGAKWQRNTKGAVADYKNGINRVTQSPGVAAAENIAAYQAGIQRALDDGRTERAMRSVDLADWKDRAVNVGAGRIQGGVDAAADTVADFQQKLYQVNSALNKSLPKRGSISDNIQRMVAQVEAMASMKGKF